ncbi:MAG: hypothetical protein SH808_03500 [Saprospiraceae bacterium]|nr:hypothetical protein [Saprospiraceae bacterium]
MIIYKYKVYILLHYKTDFFQCPSWMGIGSIDHMAEKSDRLITL